MAKEKTEGQRKHSRNNSKARHLQQWVAERISQMLNIPVEKDGEIESRQMGQQGADVILRGIAVALFPAAIECGSGESIQWLEKIRQAREHKSKRAAYFFWLVFLKRKEFKNPVVIMDAEYYFSLVEEVLKKRRLIA